MTAAAVAPARTADQLIADVHPHVAELTYVDNMPWLTTIVRTVAGHIRDGIGVTDRMIEIALVAAERDHRSADTGRDTAADRPVLSRAPQRTRGRGRTEQRTDVTGIVRYRSRRSHRGGSTIRLQVERPDGSELWLTWPEDATPVRPGDTIRAQVTLTTDARGTRATRLTGPERIARPHEQYDR